MGPISGVLVGVLVFVVILAVAAPIVVFWARRKVRSTIAATANQPFAYGVPMNPVPGSARDFGVDVVGLPGVVSVFPFTRVPMNLQQQLDPLLVAERAWMAEPPARVHLKVPLGPDWPRLAVLYRAGGQQAGTALARSIGTAGTEIATGDPAFDRDYYVGSGTPDPRPALAVVNPQVRQMVLGGRVQRWQIGGGMWLEVGFFDAAQESAAIDWTIRLARLIVTSSGIPVVRPSTPGHELGGQVPA